MAYVMLWLKYKETAEEDEVSFGIYKLGELAELRFGMLSSVELGEVSSA